MSSQTTDHDPRSPLDTTDFGIFYPVGRIVVGFPDPVDAQRVQRDLMTRGYEQQDCTVTTVSRSKI